MAKVKFFNPRKLGKSRYPKGVCEVPDAHCQGWFWDEIVKAGDVAPVGATVPITAVGSLDGKKPGAAGGPPKMAEDVKAAFAQSKADDAKADLAAMAAAKSKR